MVDRVLKLSLVEYMILNRSVFVLGLPRGIDYNSVQQTFLSCHFDGFYERWTEKDVEL